MLILLPPSEGKTAPASGAPLDLAALSFPELTPMRDQVLSELIDVSGTPTATKTLKVSDGLAEVVAANQALRAAPAAPAAEVYTGVLFDALGLASLTPAARRRADEQILIFSALFGVLRPSDRIPAYRLSGSVSLPGIGGLGRFWKPVLDDVLDVQTGPIVDCRSSAYAAMWRPRGALGVRVFRESGGKRTVVTHMAKHARGLIARALVASRRTPRDPEALVEALARYFADHEVRTATGELVTIRVELAPDSLDVITG